MFFARMAPDSRAAKPACAGVGEGAAGERELSLGWGGAVTGRVCGGPGRLRACMKKTMNEHMMSHAVPTYVCGRRGEALDRRRFAALQLRGGARLHIVLDILLKN